MWRKLHKRYSEIDTRLEAWWLKNKYILIVFGVAVYVRLILGAFIKDFWHDEAFQYLYSLKPWFFIIAGNDVHPPLYNLFTKLLVGWFGNDIFMLRWVGATVFSVMFILMLFFLIKDIFNERVAFWTALLVTVTPTYLLYSFEFRNYAFTLFFLMIQIYFFNKFLRFPGVGEFLGYVWFSVIILYSHYLTALVILTQIVYLAILWRCNWIEKDDLRYYVIAYIAIAILCLPLAAYSYLMAIQVQSFWFKNIGLTSLFSTFLYLVSPPLLIPVGTATFIYGIIGYGLWKWRKQLTLDHLQFGLYVLLPITVMFIISQGVAFYHHRYFLFGGVGLFVLAGWALTKIGERDVQADACFFGFYCLLVLMAWGHGFGDQFTDTPIANSVLFLENYTQNLNCDNDCIFLHTSQFSQTPYKVYLPQWRQYLITNFTKQQRFTAGGSVIEDWEVYPNISTVPKTNYTFWVSDHALMGEKIIYNEGGIYIQQIS
jgi:uncharacterized membrane protein